MRRRTESPREWPDPLPTAAAGALGLAALSLLWPVLASGVVTLAALSLVAGLLRRRAPTARASTADWRPWLAPLSLALLAWAVYFELPILPLPGRALFLAAGNLLVVGRLAPGSLGGVR
jgi:hypothetical protein